MVNWKSIQSGPRGAKKIGSCTCYNLCGWSLGGFHFWGGRRSRRCRRAQDWNKHRTYVDRCSRIQAQIQTLHLGVENANTIIHTSKNTDTTSLLGNCELYQFFVPVEDDLQQLRVGAKSFLVICDLHLVRRGSVWPQPWKSCQVESIDCKSNLWSSNQFWTKLENTLW